MSRDIDQIIERVMHRLPSAVVDQIRPSHSSDEDGLWWFSLPGVERRIQIESTSGTCPFLVESDEQSSNEALRASTIDVAVQLIVDYLTAASEGRSLRLQGELFWT
jgi:hypothetical protein